MDFRILGVVEVFSGGQPLRLGGPRQRALLAYLLLHGDEITSAERLLDELWYQPPRGGVAAVQTHVSRLRRALGGRIATTGNGYAIQVEPGELDLDRVRSLLAEAGGLSDPVERSRLLRSADELWHGVPLDGLEAPFAAAEARALDELRLAAIEARLDADLEADRNEALVSELSSLIAHHPLRERLRGQLILALYRNGQQVDALEAYRETRRMLDEELGLEPGPALRELERAILRHDPLLVRPPAPLPTLKEAQARLGRRWPLVVLAAAVLGAAGAVAAVLAVGGDGPSRIAAAQPTTTRPTTTLRTTTPRQGTAPTRRVRRVRHTSPAPLQPRTVRRVGRRHRAPLAAGPSPAPAVPPPRAATLRATVPVVATTAATASAASRPSMTPRKVRATTTRTTPTTTTTPTRKTATPPVTPIVISDVFDSAQIDGTIWYQIHEGTGWDLSQHDGHVEFAFPPGTTPGPPDGTTAAISARSASSRATSTRASTTRSSPGRSRTARL